MSASLIKRLDEKYQLRHFAWVIVIIASIIQMVGSTIRNVFGVMVDPMSQTFGWSQGQIGLGYAIAALCTALFSPIAGITPKKPGSATLPFFGVEPSIVDVNGEVMLGEAKGNLCINNSWPSQIRTVYGDHERMVQTYFSQYPGKYFTGDGAKRDKDGYYWVTGRVDDVLNVSGHRIGTAEVESAVVNHPDVAESAVVGV